MIKKVVHVLYKADFGGAEESTRLLIQHFKSSKYKIEVCFLHSPGPMVDRFEKSGIQVTVINMKHGLDIFGAIRFQKYIKKNNFDIVHIQLPNILTMAISYLCAPHLICHIHMGRAGNIKGLKKILLKFLFRKMNKLIAVCRVTEKIVMSTYNIPQNKICTVHNGIALDFFNIKTDKKEYLKSLNIDYNNQILIGFAGRLIPLKQCDKIIQLLSKITNKNNFLLLVAGDGPQMNDLKELTTKLNLNDNIVFLGTRNDINKFFSIVDIFVLPSQVEAFPCVVQEAMASKLPVVAFNVGGVSEIVRDEQDGFLIKPDDFKSFQQKLMFLMENKDIREKMGKSASQRAQEFSMQKTVKKISDIYDDILSS